MVNSYNKRIKELKDKIYLPSDVNKIKFSKYNAFTIASARRLLSNPFNESTFYQDNLFSQQLSPIEEDHLPVIDGVKINDESIFKELDRNGSIILTTFHLGSYRMLISLLAKNGVDISLIVDENVVKNQSSKFSKGWDYVTKSYKNNAKLNILHVNSGSIFFKLIKLLKKGTILVVYLDGNSGVGGMNNENSNLLEIPFLNSSLMVRQGIINLSYKLKIPILLGLSYRNKGNIYFDFVDKYVSNEKENMNDYTVHTLSRIYNHFQKYLLQYSTQWEGWLYIYKLFPKSFFEYKNNIITNKNSILRFNEHRFIKYKIGEDDTFLLDIYNFKSIQINKVFEDIIEDFNLFEKQDQKVKNYLIKRGIFI